MVARSAFDPDLPPDEPLSPEELKDMRRHLAFIRKYRTVLRLRLNAREDLMVNGQREPDHRGACKYLLSKIDARTIRATLLREPLKSDARARARFLAEAAGISGDLDVLLRFLETVSLAAPGEATRAFLKAVRRIDFQAISAARLSRLLDVMQTAFSEHELAGALFGLLQSRGFRQAFDGHAQALKPEVAARFVPLRAVYEAIWRGGRRQQVEPSLEEGLRVVLSAPKPMLKGYPKQTRKRLLDSALRVDADWVMDHPGIPALLRSMRAGGEAQRRYGSIFAKRLIRHQRFDQALRILKQNEAQEDPATRELVRRLEAPRRGLLSLEVDPEQGDGLQRAYHLGLLQPVLVRFGESAEQLAAEAQLQARVCLPGVAHLALQDCQHTPPFLALALQGRRLDQLLADRKIRLARADVVALALAGLRILRALGLAGVVLPDAAPQRFVVPRGGNWTGMLLADFRGARRQEPDMAQQAAREQAADWCRAALSFPPFRGESLRRDLSDALKSDLRKALRSQAQPWQLAALLIEAGQA